MPWREAKTTLTSVLLILVSAPVTSESPSAAERFQSLQAQLRKSHASNDWRSNLASANELSELLNEAPNSLLEIARAEIHLGDLESAIRNIEQFVRMGQSTDLLETSAEFAPLRKTRSFATIQSGMKANRSAIALGSTVFTLSDSKLLAEDMALGDMPLAPNDDVIVSDGEGGRVYRLPAKATVLEHLDNGEFISPQTPAMYTDGKHIFVPDYLRGIGVLEISTKQVRWLSMGEGFALNGIDGLYFDHGTLIAVQNGTSPERVVAFDLDPSLTRITSETIIERSTNTLGDPTHGVIIDDDFYYIANSGWDVIDDHGNMRPGAKPSEPRVMRARVRHKVGSAT